MKLVSRVFNLYLHFVVTSARDRATRAVRPCRGLVVAGSPGLSNAYWGGMLHDPLLHCHTGTCLLIGPPCHIDARSDRLGRGPLWCFIIFKLAQGPIPYF